MATSIQNLLKERKYPFILSLFVVLLSVTIFLLTATQSPLYFAINLDQWQSISSPPPPHSISSPLPPQSISSSSPSQLISPSPPQQSVSLSPPLQSVSLSPPSQSVSFSPPSQSISFSPPSQSVSLSPPSQSVSFSPPSDYKPPISNANTKTPPQHDKVSSQSVSFSPPSDYKPPISNANTKTPPQHDKVSSNVSVTFTDLELNWKVCEGFVAVDYIPCLDNFKVMKKLKGKRHIERKERHCPKPSPRCLVPLPQGYRVPVLWPKSRDMIWFDNVPHPKLVEYKKEQNWVRKSGDFFVFPGGGTQFKNGVSHYIGVIEKTLPAIKWGTHIRVVLDVGCGVASFGGALLNKDVLTMSFAPKDEHEAQIQFALERGIPATLLVIGTKRLTFPDNVYDLIHCARCRVHWHADGGRPLLELNRILRPGGFFIWSATPVYQKDKKHQDVWKSMVALTESICWKQVAKIKNVSGVGLVIYQKPVSSSCYATRKENNPPLCDQNYRKNNSWYVPLDKCISPLPIASMGDSDGWPATWPKRLSSKPPTLSTEQNAEEVFYEDTKHWFALVSEVYLEGLAINWSRIRNVMDMNAGYGGFASALIDLPLWVMNTIPIDLPDTLSIIFDRGLIGIYHDWCEPFNTYPRTYDLLHSSFLFGNLTQRCDMIDVAVEMDRILRPSGYILVHDTLEMINKLGPILRSLHWSITIHQEQFLVGKKDFWRPDAKSRF